jgi:anti-sigma regulatory factor (Ser/Thr protein kinase)
MSEHSSATGVSSGWRGPGTRVFGACPQHAGQVRDLVRSVITGHRCPVDPADAVLAADELFANAVLYGPPGGRVLIGYGLWPGGARLVVADGGGPGTPRLRPDAGLEEGRLAEGGRGLRLVDALSARWGTFRLPDAQVVWCDFRQPLPAAAGDAWAWLPPVLTAHPLAPDGAAGSCPARAAAAPCPMPRQPTGHLDDGRDGT